MRNIFYAPHYMVCKSKLIYGFEETLIDKYFEPNIIAIEYDLADEIEDVIEMCKNCVDDAYGIVLSSVDGVIDKMQFEAVTYSLAKNKPVFYIMDGKIISCGCSINLVPNPIGGIFDYAVVKFRYEI